MIEPGKYNHLEILRETSIGLYLGDDSGEDVLLPNKYCPAKFDVGDKIVVFVYFDNEGRKIATSLTPQIFLNEFAFLKVSAVNEIGAFMDWGLEKELLVPFNEQRQKMEAGRWYIVYLDIDAKTGRLYATNKLEKHLQNDKLTIEKGDEVPMLVMSETDLGYTVIVNNAHKGLLYRNEIFEEINIGDALTGYIKNIRSDNKLDISLQPLGYHASVDTNVKRIMDSLAQNHGFLPLTDKTSPEIISEKLGISKKAFKKAIGYLLKKKKVELSPDGIRAINS